MESKKYYTDEQLRKKLISLPEHGKGALVVTGDKKQFHERTWELTHPSYPDYEATQAIWELQGFPMRGEPIWVCIRAHMDPTEKTMSWSWEQIKWKSL